jgi:hypothetical protein
MELLLHILLIIFYNEMFGILVGNSLGRLSYPHTVVECIVEYCQFIALLLVISYHVCLLDQAKACPSPQLADSSLNRN